MMVGAILTLSGSTAAANPTGPALIEQEGNSNPTTECVEVASTYTGLTLAYYDKVEDPWVGTGENGLATTSGTWDGASDPSLMDSMP